MARNKEATGYVIKVAVILSLVCATLVSLASVGLKPIQAKNAAREKQLNILKAAGIYTPGMNIEDTFKEKFVAEVIDIKTGDKVDGIDPLTFDMTVAAKDPAQNIELTEGQDIAKIGSIAKDAVVYYLQENGQTSKVIVPINGYGLWGTMYGFLALDKDGKTIKGITFYDHKETPGLGGEITNPNWQALWDGKKPFGGNSQPVIRLVKGGVSSQPEKAQHQVDSLAGATLTSRGVEHMINFWLGENGYQPFLTKFANK